MAKMKKNKYLDDLGVPLEKYGTNFCNDEDDGRQLKWKKERKKYGFDSRETWYLSNSFVEWIYSRCMMYKDLSSKFIDLEYHKIEYDGIVYTQKEALDIIINCAKDYLLDDTAKLVYENMQYATHLWAELLPYMWW